MTARKIRVFVSSVAGSLKPTRAQIIEDLNKAGYDVTAMERFGAQPTVPLDACLSELRKSDAFVLLVGPRYGSVLPQGISYTHAEFREARSAGIPVFAIRIPTDANVEADERTQLEAFSTEVGSTTTYDGLAPGETLDRVSPRVLAALSGARDRGELGHKFSVFQKYDRYFAPQLVERQAATRRALSSATASCGHAGLATCSPDSQNVASAVAGLFSSHGIDCRVLEPLIKVPVPII